MLDNIRKLAHSKTRIIVSVPNEKFILRIKKFLKSLKLMNMFMKGIEDHTSEWHIQVFDDKLVKKLVKKDFDILKTTRIFNIYLVYLLRKKA